ncbi:MAG: hypothetical protein Q4G67_03125 [Actinomycetia bacterium]|nr:hypothetical protein [Actinomycetes bacterium]
MARLIGTAVTRHPTTDQVVVLRDGDEVPEWAEVGQHLLGDEAAGDAPSESWTVAQLRAYADEHDVDLGEATRKADILDALAAS